jgi:hypothetical protein
MIKVLFSSILCGVTMNVKYKNVLFCAIFKNQYMSNINLGPEPHRVTDQAPPNDAALCSSATLFVDTVNAKVNNLQVTTACMKSLIKRRSNICN